jgi:hypothetical protein
MYVFTCLYEELVIFEIGFPTMEESEVKQSEPFDFDHTAHDIKILSFLFRYDFPSLKSEL